ncbi:MAG: hypothetical protein GWN40_01250 [Nitrosopumilaceae archaeon]|nr:hypothetical protein [Nitrosopumilaceae archaeon]
MTKKEEFLYDVRVADRHIQDGAISKKEYESHLKNLPDVEEKGEALIIEEDKVSAEEEVQLNEAEIDEIEEGETE